MRYYRINNEIDIEHMQKFLKGDSKQAVQKKITRTESKAADGLSRDSILNSNRLLTRNRTQTLSKGLKSQVLRAKNPPASQTELVLKSLSKEGSITAFKDSSRIAPEQNAHPTPTGTQGEVLDSNVPPKTLIKREEQKLTSIFVASPAQKARQHLDEEVQHRETRLPSAISVLHDENDGAEKSSQPPVRSIFSNKKNNMPLHAPKKIIFQ